MTYQTKTGAVGVSLPRRVMIVSATFAPDRSYQENLWAESLADMGCEVSVCMPVDEGHLGRGASSFTLQTFLGSTYQVVEVSSKILIRNSVLSEALATQALEISPDLCIWFGGIMYFGRALYLDPRLASIPIITVYSLSRRGRHSFSWYERSATWRARAVSLAFQVLRAPVLTQTLRRAELTIANTPECTDIIRQYVWGEDRVAWARKHVEIPLGFCPYTFSYRAPLRAEAREALSLKDSDVVFLFSTRFATDKWPALQACFQAVELGFQIAEERASTNDTPAPKLHMIWIGADQGEVTGQMRALIQTARAPSQHHLISFQNRQRLATWYHTADIILFPQPSISVQEAIGSGARVLCPPDPSLDHLREYGGRMERYQMEQWPDRIAALSASQDHERERVKASKQAQTLAYPQLIMRALLELERRLG